MNEKFTKEQVIENLKALAQRLEHEPTAQEIDKEPSLPTSRQIQRRHGGLRRLREEAGLKIIDHTAGEKGREKAIYNLKNSKKYEKDLYNKLVRKYHDPSGITTYVTRQFAWQQWLPEEGYYANTNADVAIDDRVKKHVILIDFFYAQDVYSLDGCVSIKKRKYEKNPVKLFGDSTHEIIFVCVNDKIKNIKKAKKEGYSVLLFDEFEERFLQ